eukprot:GHVS01008833.1.p1 GENE.GHVS01008833.1~~GHVS01008833.1.p1  ORF type:complete len:477 (+),score=145.57 GHVS01008833.1:184-1614(+)
MKLLLCLWLLFVSSSVGKNESPSLTDNQPVAGDVQPSHEKPSPSSSSVISVFLHSLNVSLHHLPSSSSTSLVAFSATSPTSAPPVMLTKDVLATDKHEVRISASIHDSSSSEAVELSQLSVLVSLLHQAPSSPPLPDQLPTSKLLSLSSTTSSISVALSNSKLLPPIDGLYLFELIAADTRVVKPLRLALLQMQITFGQRLKVVQTPLAPPPPPPRLLAGQTNKLPSPSSSSSSSSSPSSKSVLPRDTAFHPRPILSHTFDVTLDAGEPLRGYVLLFVFLLPLAALFYFWNRYAANLKVLARLLLLSGPPTAQTKTTTTSSHPAAKQPQDEAAAAAVGGGGGGTGGAASPAVGGMGGMPSLYVWCCHISFVCLLCLVFFCILCYFFFLDLFTVTKYICFLCVPLFYFGHAALSSLREYKQSHHLHVTSTWHGLVVAPAVALAGVAKVADRRSSAAGKTAEERPDRKMEADDGRKKS